MEHQGRTALVTGAAGDIGRAIAVALAEDGARVILTDVKDLTPAVARVEAAVSGARVETMAVDLADPRAAKAALAGQPIDILINNAAVNPQSPIDVYDLDEYERTQAINATSPVALAMAAAPHMKAQGWGAVVNITSVTLNGGWKDFTAYVASKGTLLGFTRSLARELGPWNIRVNCVSPGAIPTQLERDVWAGQLETYEKYLLDHQALKFRPTAADIGEAVRFCCSGRSRFMTGHNLVIDGGWWMT